MKRAVKNYLVFTGWGYRICILLLLPLLFVGFHGLVFFVEDGMPLAFMLIVGYCTYIMADVAGDYWFLPGFYKKNNSAVRFLQTSNRYKTLIRDVVVLDMLRRFLAYGLLYGVMYLMGMRKEAQKEWFILFSFMPLYCFVISQTAVFFIRHFNSWQHTISTSSLAAWLIVPFFFLMEHGMEHGYTKICFAVLGVLAVLVAVITILYSMKKVRDSYYDK